MREQFAVIATPSTFPRLPASNATIATVLAMGKAAAKKVAFLVLNNKEYIRL
jgi:hypothetical protein